MMATVMVMIIVDSPVLDALLVFDRDDGPCFSVWVFVVFLGSKLDTQIFGHLVATDRVHAGQI